MSDPDAGPVVVGIDGSDQSLKALRVALAEARWRDTELHVVHSVDVAPARLHMAGGETLDTREMAQDRHDEVWAQVAPIVGDAGVQVVRVDRLGYPADELVDHCEEVEAGMLVVGTRGRGRVKSAVLGSTSMKALTEAHCPVLVAK